MAWPPPTMAINKANETDQQNDHAAHHNALGQAVNDLVTRVQLHDKPIAARVFRQQALTMPNSSVYTITWDSTDYNDFGMFASPSDRLTVPANGAGLYLVQCHMSFAPATSGSRAIWFVVNGASNQRIGKTEFAVVNYTADFAFTTSTLLKLSATQFVQVQYFGTTAQCNVGADATISQCVFSMVRIGGY